MHESEAAALAGVYISSQTRCQLETRTGQSVVSAANYLPPGAPLAERPTANLRRSTKKT